MIEISNSDENDVLIFDPIDPKVLNIARSLALNSKPWGKVQRKSISAGFWDNGFTVRKFVPDAEIALIKMQQEKSED